MSHMHLGPLLNQNEISILGYHVSTEIYRNNFGYLCKIFFLLTEKVSFLFHEKVRGCFHKIVAYRKINILSLVFHVLFREKII